MLQPFEPFKAIYINKLLDMNKYWLVSQTYPRYDTLVSDEAKTGLLLTDYADVNMAKTHVKALTGDKYAALLYLQYSSHRAKLVELMGEYSKFQVFWGVVKNVKELEEKINRGYKEHMKLYIEKHTQWRINRETVLRPSVQLIFGELFIVLKYGSQTVRVKFEDIDKK